MKAVNDDDDDDKNITIARFRFFDEANEIHARIDVYCVTRVNHQSVTRAARRISTRAYRVSREDLLAGKLGSRHYFDINKTLVGRHKRTDIRTRVHDLNLIEPYI